MGLCARESEERRREKTGWQFQTFAKQKSDLRNHELMSFAIYRETERRDITMPLSFEIPHLASGCRLVS